MTTINRTQVEQVIDQYQDPYYQKPLSQVNAVKTIQVSPQGEVSVELQFAYPNSKLVGGIQTLLSEAIKQLSGVKSAKVEISTSIPVAKGQNNLPAMAGVKNIIAVASGKGGVGKSTTTVNLALALAANGANVGILDADIYGPSQGLMLGVKPGERPEVQEVDGKPLMKPVIAHGIQVMSMAFLVDENTPMVWRGPMVSGALQQLLTQTLWQDLDYLFVDMPPGTGDIQLTLAQRVPVAGAIIVTTPQDLALLDAKKGIEMFRKVNVPVIGVVENMSTHICSQCGHIEHLFGEGGGQNIAEQYQTTLLGALPLSMAIREQVDGGMPTVAADPEGQLSYVYQEIARRAAALLSEQTLQAVAVPTISVVDD
ncbi:iron-sulfur cluster carrier protein ApbC [Endozoicomonas sp. SM1973]|uniref:Iron-sulfur cluster carrier protein n=1 Tax=Spartinivicinus marinus TaxID=2994442 RepID=A0A853I6W2_9GAMM|nr:iron-sulfur cluster carrier protein ApbC [Spartinivicinus marinus]MCX4025464.1 iron-sulfur cluster carrier protein ApbC [Spartinivicinus marinus]NYZ65307.1 iron-sulfur cluster carrier protein ApbC [Spartinivicinus marinus]